MNEAKRHYNTILKNRYLRWVMTSVLMVFSLAVQAEESANSCDSVSSVVNISKIYYPVNKVTIYEDYMNNPKELNNIKLHLAQSPRIDSIIIYSFASPEGPYNWNTWLANERGKTAKRYILANVPKTRQFPDSLIIVKPTSENWAGMREEVVKLYNRADKDKILEIIDRPGIGDERRKQLIKALDGGNSWRFIIKNIMPQLRYATWIAVWQPIAKSIAAPMPPQLTTAEIEIDTPVIEVPQLVLPTTGKREIRDTKTILALKTNLLYDAVTWFNFSVEVPFAGDNFSVLYYHQFPWWRAGQSDNEFCNRFLSIGGEARWWFKPEPRPATEKRKKRDRLVGHFLGVYGESGKWDFEQKRKICYQGEHWSTGLSYGYSLPISRSLNMEFSISGGYASIAYRGYTPSPDYSILWRDYDKIGRWHYWGLTKAQVTLVVPIVVKTKKRVIYD